MSVSAVRDVLADVHDVARRRRPDDQVLERLITPYWSAAPDDDVASRDPEALLDVTEMHLDLARRHQPGTAAVRVRPGAASDGAGAVVLVVADDAPFMVDSLRMAIERFDVAIRLLVHPMLGVERKNDGAIVAIGPTGDAGRREAWTQIEIDPIDAAMAADLEAVLADTLDQLRGVVADFPAMLARMGDLSPVSPLLEWLTADEFVFLGAADYERIDGELRLVAGSELGTARRDATLDPPDLPAVDDRPVVVTRADSVSRIHRPARQVVVIVRTAGGESRFVGLLASTAQRVSVFDIPGVGEALAEALDLDGAGRHSYLGRAARNVVEGLPRVMVLENSPGVVAELVWDIVGLQDRRLVRVFVVPEAVPGRANVLVYLPRQRYSAELPGQIAALVVAATGADDHEVATDVGSSSLARITIGVEGAALLDDGGQARLAQAIDDVSTAWVDRFRVAAVDDLGDDAGTVIAAVAAIDVPAGFRAATPPEHAVSDLADVATLLDGAADVEIRLVPPPNPGEPARIKVFRRNQPLTLAELLPLLGSLGVEAIDERSYDFARDGDVVHLYDLGVQAGARRLGDDQRAELRRAMVGLLRGDAELDLFNRLILGAGLTVREVAVVRAYARYLAQIGFPFSERYVAERLAAQGELVRLMVDRFRARFDPSIAADERAALEQRRRDDVAAALDALVSLDDDRIARAIHQLIDATMRTNWFQGGPDVAFKLDPSRIADIPLPRPAHEIWVCGPTIEGVHLRGGAIARGGLRWSDRREDFRTEVLGLLKAQMVKNAVIVPTGAKGGFVLKQPAPADPGDQRALGVAGYRAFISALLDVTDNLVDGDVVPPPDCVVLDGDDPYLVVAADKGTATFSDIANEIALDRGFWMGDAFASGGSVGYDHKAMGITARGAWESARRHGVDLGIDVDITPFTAVGIGDMSGDVFGNGMLLSRAVRLVAAFDHRHIFIDPDPAGDAAFDERQRLFGLPRSSWADYDEALLSPGGAVYPRSLKQIRLSEQAAAALGTTTAPKTPAEVISAILMAPVVMLWNGGVGTYVKASSESNTEVGDRANDGLRVDGADLRCAMVVEGGNLGVTQLGRVEYALAGGLINTDAIDNSAGVDCSDHEVNIKILLGQAIDDEALAADERNDLLASMTNEVGELVLGHNRAQNLALTIARRQSAPMANVHARYIDQLEAEQWLDRAIEFLPPDKQLAERAASGQGLTVPELAVLIAYTKNANVAELLQSDLPDLELLVDDLVGYFPHELGERFAEQIQRHRLRREIVSTVVMNEMVNLSGISFDHRLTEDTGASVVDVTRSWIAARGIFGFDAWWTAIDRLTGRIPSDTQLELFLECRRMAERAVLWLIRHRRPPYDTAAAIAMFQPGVDQLSHTLGTVVGGRLGTEFDSLEASRLAAGVPEHLAERASVWPILHIGLDLVVISGRVGQPIERAAAAYWELFERLDLQWLWEGIGLLDRATRWQTQARSAMRDELLAVLADLTAIVLETASRSVAGWLDVNSRQIQRAGQVFADLRRSGPVDLTTAAVALRQLRNLTLTSVLDT